MSQEKISTAMRTFTLAVHQHIPTPDNLAASLARIRTAASEASSKGAHLLLVPEASVTGYNISLASARAIAIEHDDATSDELKSIAQECAIALAYGYIERCGNALFNSVRVIAADGTTLSHYRKTHLWGDLDRRLFTAGDSFSSAFTLDGWKIGLLICYDIEFPETARHLALAGCDLILIPTALMTPWTFVADHITRVRAAENQLYVAYANYCGSENGIDYVGHSSIAGPDGEILAKASTEPALLISSLSPDAISSVRAALPYHRDRRPELYHSKSNA